MGATSQDQDRGRPAAIRRAASSLAACVAARASSQAVATERDLAAGLLRTDTYLRTHEEVPPLVEIEDDHFVAISAGATTNRLLPGDSRPTWCAAAEPAA